MLSHLTITNFRKFDRYRLEFGRRNLLVGSNNAGKSTVIEVLRLISVVVNACRKKQTWAARAFDDRNGGASRATGRDPSLLAV